MSGEPQDQEHSGECEQQRGHDDARVCERFELSCHHDVHQDDYQHAEHQQVGERILLVLVGTGYLDRYVSRQVHVVDCRLCVGHDVAEGAAVHYRRDCNDTLAVLTLDGGRCGTFHNLTKLLEAYALTGTGVYHYVLQVLDAGTELGSVHHFHVIFLAVLAELRGRGAVDAVTQIVRGRRQVNAVHGQFLAVEVHLIFRLIVGTRYDDVGGTLDAGQRAFELLCHGVGLLEVIAVDLEVYRRLSAH